MLDKSTLADSLEVIFLDVPADDQEGKTKEDQASEIAAAISDYLAEAVIGMPPSGTGSSITFPAAAALSASIIIPDATDATVGTMFETVLTTALLTATSVSLGKADGTPVPPGTQILLEIGGPPIVPPIFNGIFGTDDQTAKDAAIDIADAIHNSVSTILYNGIHMIPSPAGPIPVPMVPMKIK